MDVADNVDLIRIIQEFEESHEVKYGKRPKLVRKLVEEVQGGGGAMRQVTSAGSVSSHSRPPLPGGDGPPVSGVVAARQRREKAAGAEDQKKQEILDKRQALANQYKPPPEIGGQRIAGVLVDGKGPVSNGDELPLMQVQGVVFNRQSRGPANVDSESDEDLFERKILKPMPASLQGELRELGAAITRDIFTGELMFKSTNKNGWLLCHMKLKLMNPSQKTLMSDGRTFLVGSFALLSPKQSITMFILP